MKSYFDNIVSPGKGWFYKTGVYVSAAFLFFIANLQAISVISLITLFVCWCIYAIIAFSRRTNEIINASGSTAFSKHKVAFLMMAFYMLHVISLLYTSNFTYGFFDLQVKLAFFIFPLIFTAFILGQKERFFLMTIFISGCTGTSLGLFILALTHYSHSQNIGDFFYISFSGKMHPTYFAIYLNTAVLLVFDILMRRKNLSIFQRSMLFTSFFINSSVILLLMSRMSLVVFLFTYLLFVIIALKNKEFKLVKWLSIHAVFLGILFYLILSQFNRFTQVTAVAQSVESNTHTEVLQENNSTTTRMHLWKNAWELIRENPVLGVGVGDLKEELVKKYEKNHYDYGVQTRMSPHNQFLHTMVILGIPGLILLLSILFVPMMMAIRQQQWIYVIFLLIIFLNSITESILERQAGILFFTFFTCFFYTGLKEKNSLIKV